MPDAESADTDARRSILGSISMAEPWAIRVAATLRLADIVTEEGVPVADLAAASGSHPQTLERLLRFLVARGLFLETAPSVFALNDPARLLRDDHPGRLQRWLDLEGAGGLMDSAYSGMLETVRTGKPAYPLVRGHGFWEDLAADPQLARSFASLMEAHSSDLAHQVVSGYPWDRVEVVVDVGGGSGALLASILHSQPNLRGILVDLVADSADTTRILEGAGVDERCQRVRGDFFSRLPPGGDVYLLRNIIHDWPDEPAIAILRRCSEAAGARGKILVVERVTTGEDDQRELTGMDLRMLTLFGSRERSFEEFHVLASSAGLVHLGSQSTSSSYWLLEYEPSGFNRSIAVSGG